MDHPHGEIQDPEFLRFLEEIGRERMAAFSTDDFLVIDLVHRGETVPDHLKPRIEHLLNQGVIERMGRGRGVRLLLSRRFYRHLGKAQQVLPALARSQIQVLMRELVREGSVHVHGATKAARWYPGPQRADCNHKEAWLQ